MKPFYVSLKPFLDYRTLSCPVSWKEIFAQDKPLEVEIGFGNGEYLARLAQSSPQTNFVGFEEYCERIQKTLRKLSRVTHPNVRVLRMDVRPAFDYLFASQSISYIHCLYPPPWPKKSDIKHRLFTPHFLKVANNRLVTGGVLKIVTDFYPYILWVQEQLPGCGFKAELARIKASYDTKFERKWVEGGQKEFFELILTKDQHMPIEPKKEAELKHYQLETFNPRQFQMKEYSKDGIAVIFKDLLYDELRGIALVHVLVNDEHIFQNIRILFSQTPRGWQMNLAEGSMMMPTAGVTQALELVYQAARATGTAKILEKT
jgi:tRNA (guanine-N7-)-methyltransferase